MTRDLSRLLRPQSIAVFGGGWSENVIKQARSLGFEGQIWPVHPTKTELCGLPAYASVHDLPAAPDASFIGINRDATIDIVSDLAKMNAGGAVCFASGFREVEDGEARQDKLTNAAGDMPILGPNCYGFINYLDGALLWPDQHGGKRVKSGAAIILQSSNIAINLTMQTRALPIAYMLTAGNQAQIGLSDLASAALDDPRVTCLGLHIEGFDDLARFEDAMAKARRLGKPVVVLKVGQSVAAQSMTVSHTASLAGADDLATAFLARCGAARVRTLEEFLETLKLLHVLGPSPDRTLGSMSCSGGEASLVGDLVENTDLFLRPFSEPEKTQIASTLSELVTISNPLDYHTFIWGDFDKMTATYAAMLEGGFGLTLLVLDFPNPARCEDHGAELAMRAAIRAAKITGHRLAITSSLPETMPVHLAEQMIDAGVAPLMGLEAAILAADHATSLQIAMNATFPSALLQPVLDPSTLEVLNEAESKDILAALGIPVPASAIVQTADQLPESAASLGGPVAVKGLSSEVAHKTEAGAVLLNLETADDFATAAGRISPPYLVERMVENTVAELIVGVARDPQFGLYMTLGAGGVLVELLDDAKPILLPTSRDELRKTLMSLKIWPLLDGFRGRPKADLDAILDVAMKIADYAVQENARLEELDINPLMIREDGAIAADALIRIRRD